MVRECLTTYLVVVGCCRLLVDGYWLLLCLPLPLPLLRLSLLFAFDTSTWPQMRFCLPSTLSVSVSVSGSDPFFPVTLQFCISLSCLRRPHAPIEGRSWAQDKPGSGCCCWGSCQWLFIRFILLTVHITDFFFSHTLRLQGVSSRCLKIESLARREGPRDGRWGLINNLQLRGPHAGRCEPCLAD